LPLKTILIMRSDDTYSEDKYSGLGNGIKGAMDMLIRKATLKDAKHIAQLVLKQETDANQSAGESYADPHPWHRTLSSVLASPEWTFFLAVDGESKIGLLAFHIRPSLKDGKKRATITNLVIADDYVNQGIERQLVEEAMKSASAKGCTGLYATVDSGDNESLEMFKVLGFRRDREFFELQLKR
jgi:N-acetylglutamate synthase-like GNAT family acetyltransferase